MGAENNKHRRGLAACIVACGLAAPAWAQRLALTPEELYDRVAPSVWLVGVRLPGGQGALGSAVVIAPGVLITNCHVVEKAATITVSHDRLTHAARLQYHDPTRDLCQLAASGVLAPSVPLAPSSALHPGQKVYAIGNPRGLELTISDGLVSGLRRNAAGQLQLVQISVPISPGSSGGGLFDVYGRLVGITTSGLRESQNLNFALPSEWVLELPRRLGGEVVASMQPAALPIPAAAATPPAPAPALISARAPAVAAPRPTIAAPAPVPVPVPAAIVAIARPPAPEQPSDPRLMPMVGRVYEYRLRDRLTGRERTVTFQVDRIDGDRVSFNGGSRIEDLHGIVIRLAGAVAGEADAAMPPGGWLHSDATPGASWPEKYTSHSGPSPIDMDFKAHVVGAEDLHVAGLPVHALRIEFRGYTTRGPSIGRPPTGRYVATGWYAQGRLVRFQARTRAGMGGDAFFVDELLELVAIH